MGDTLKLFFLHSKLSSSSLIAWLCYAQIQIKNYLLFLCRPFLLFLLSLHPKFFLSLFCLPIDSSTDLFPLKSSARLPRSVLQREYEGQIGTQTYDTNINIEQASYSSMFTLRYIITSMQFYDTTPIRMPDIEGYPEKDSHQGSVQLLWRYLFSIFKHGTHLSLMTFSRYDRNL